MRKIHKACIKVSLVFCYFLLLINAETIYGNKFKKITYCDTKNICSKYEVSESLQTFLDDSSIEKSYSIEEFADGKKYFLLTSNMGGGVNICYESINPIVNDVIHDDIFINLIPKIDKRISVSPSNKMLCNYRKLSNGRLISSYRSGARWYDEMYQYENESYVLKTFDEHYGDFIIRTTYVGDNKQKSLVSEFESAKDYDKRVALSGIVEIDKLYLFSQPDKNKKTSNYLIKNNTVKLLDYIYPKDDSDDFWLFVEFINPKMGKIQGWVDYSGVEINYPKKVINEGELDIFFSCNLTKDRKLILYAEKDSGEIAIKYKFTNSDHSEFIYPQKKNNSLFTFAKYFRYQTEYYRVFFDNGIYEYMIFRNFNNENNEKLYEAGVIVTNTKTEKDSSFVCIKTTIDNLSDVENYISEDTKGRL